MFGLHQQVGGLCRQASPIFAADLIRRAVLFDAFLFLDYVGIDAAVLRKLGDRGSEKLGSRHPCTPQSLSFAKRSHDQHSSAVSGDYCFF